MTSENLVTIDFDSDVANSDHNADISSINCYNRETSEILFSGDNNLEDIERINESQPLLGGGSDSHDGHQIIYNQFPSKF